jgi:hypothetical protein
MALAAGGAMVLFIRVGLGYKKSDYWPAVAGSVTGLLVLAAKATGSSV